MSTAVRDDAAIRSDVLLEFSYDPIVTAYDVAVVVNNGVVALSGVADSYGTRAAIYDAARRVLGVRDVRDEVVVDPHMLGRPTDAEIEADVRYRLDHDPFVPKGEITLSVADGVVTLTGTVRWHFQRMAARDEAREAKGVREVNNQIKIKHTQVAPAEIEGDIRKAFLRNARLDARQIHVAVDGDKAILTGTAHNLDERDEAVSTAWRARGINQVTDQITVQP